MPRFVTHRRAGFRRAIAIAALCALVGAGASAQQQKPAEKKPELEKSGAIQIEQYQIAFLYSGNLGGGKLRYKDKDYPFTIGGLGIGGVGASKIEAVGEVYNLKRLEDFPGAYGQARWGYVAGDTSAGTLWLQNPAGVVLEIRAKREGLALSLGADAVYFAFK